MLRALFALCLLCCLVLSEGRPRRHFSKHGKGRRAIKGVDETQVDLVDRIVNGAAAHKTSHPYMVSILQSGSDPEPDTGNTDNTGNNGNNCNNSNNGNSDYEYYYDYEDDDTEDNLDDDGWDSEGPWKRSRLDAKVPRPWQLGGNKPGNGHGYGQQQGNRPDPGKPQPPVETGNDTENEVATSNEVRPVVEQGKPGHGHRPGNAPRPSFMQARGNATRWKHHHSRRHVKAHSTRSFHICGGALIDPQWVLTAAHCVGGPLSVKIGEYNMSNHLELNEQEIPVTKSIPHPNYDENTIVNDIALLKLSQSVDITKENIETIALPTSSLQQGVACTIAGWGNIHAVAANKRRRRTYTSKNFMQQPEFPNILQEAQVQVLSQDECKKAYSMYGNDVIQPTMVCASNSTHGIDSCQGDSGGPLIGQEGGNKTVVGVVSWGLGCAQKKFPGVYTRVHDYVSWIRSIMQANP